VEDTRELAGQWKVSSAAKVEEFNDKLIEALDELRGLSSRYYPSAAKKRLKRALELVSELNDLWVEVVVLDEVNENEALRFVERRNIEHGRGSRLRPLRGGR